MSPLPALASRGFLARTTKVVSLRRVEATVDLEFGVSVDRTFVIDGLDHIDLRDEGVRDQAKLCLIVLVGSKRLFIRPDPRLRQRWSYLREIPARVYLCEGDRARLLGRPVGYIEALPEVGGAVLELGPYLSWLAREGFDVDLVKETLNGPRT